MLEASNSSWKMSDCKSTKKWTIACKFTFDISSCLTKTTKETVFDKDGPAVGFVLGRTEWKEVEGFILVICQQVQSYTIGRSRKSDRQFSALSLGVKNVATRRRETHMQTDKRLTISINPQANKKRGKEKKQLRKLRLSIYLRTLQ